METFSQLSFSLHVGWQTLLLGVLWGGGLGLLGAIAPGVAAVRMKVVDALKRG